MEIQNSQDGEGYIEYFTQEFGGKGRRFVGCGFPEKASDMISLYPSLCGFLTKPFLSIFGFLASSFNAKQKARMQRKESTWVLRK